MNEAHKKRLERIMPGGQPGLTGEEYHAARELVAHLEKEERVYHG